MDLGKLKDFVMKDNIFTASVLIAIVVFIGSITFYSYSQLKSVERNVETAILKGIDPIAVRCAYADARDIVCVAYAASHNPSPKK